MSQIEMRLRGTERELKLWLWFLRKLDEKDLIELLSVSEFYADRGETKLGRIYG